jgi:hypothetical protein
MLDATLYDLRLWIVGMGIKENCEFIRKKETTFSNRAVSSKMYLTRSEYDHGVSTFSPDGRLFQVEYAVSSIKLGSTAIGIQTAEGIVLAVEKARKRMLIFIILFIYLFVRFLK